MAWVLCGSCGAGQTAPEVEVADSVDPTSHCPSGYLPILVSSRPQGGVDDDLHVVPTVGEAGALARRLERTSQVARGFCILLDARVRHRIHRGTEVDFEGGHEMGCQANLGETAASCPNCTYCRRVIRRERNRFAFYWNVDAPLYLASTGGRAVLESPKDYIDAADPCCEPCEQACVAQLSARVQGAIAVGPPPGGGTRQRVVIENITFRGWQQSAVHLYKTRGARVRGNAIEQVGTYFWPEESYRTAENARRTDDEPPTSGWPMYAGGAVFVHRSIDTRLTNNRIQAVLNRDVDQFPLADKIHAVYAIAARDLVIADNDVRDVSGPAIVIRHGSRDVRVVGNTFLRAAPAVGNTQDFDGSYVQQGFLRIPCPAPQAALPNACPRDVRIAYNVFAQPWCWPNQRSDCSRARAERWSGDLLGSLPGCHEMCWSEKRVGQHDSYCDQHCRGIVFEANRYIEQWHPGPNEPAALLSPPQRAGVR